MPTSGEARLLKKKQLGPKSRSTSNVKSKNTASTSRLPVAKKSSINRGKENTEPNQKLKAKPAPDFSKLHNKWNKQFEKGKAVSKKINTKTKPFVLTENNNNRPRTLQSSINNEEENIELDCNEFEIDPSALQGILNNTGIEVQENESQIKASATTQQSAQNTISGYSTKRASIYYMGAKENAKLKAEHCSTYSLMSNNNVARKTNNVDKCKAVLSNQDEEHDDDEISFKPDATALESILNNRGIDNRSLSRHTMASYHTSTRTMTMSKRQSLFEDKQSKRTSIYYNGTRQTRSNTDSSRQSLIIKSSTKGITSDPLGIRRMTSVSRPTGNPYNVGSTIVGITGAGANDENDDDEISFKPDTMALESILNNRGIDNRSLSRHTMASTRTMPLSKRQSLLDEKRTSIYYAGKKTSKMLIEPGRPSLSATTISKPNYTKVLPTSSKPLPANSKLHYALGSTVVGFQDAGPLKDEKDGDESTFTKPILPEQRKETKQLETKPNISTLMTPSRALTQTTSQQLHVKDNESKSSIYSALMTPSRSQLDTRTQAPTSTKKHVTWSAILTPHRDQQLVVNANKGGSILKKSSSKGRLAEKPCSPVLFTAPEDVTLNVCNSPTLESRPIAMKLFSNDNTTADICPEKFQLDEFERQAIKDLQSLELEESFSTQPNGNFGSKNNKIMTTPSIDISGCVPLTSPPDLVCTPSALGTPFKVPNGPQRTPMNQWIAATPENHMRVTLRGQTPSNSNQKIQPPHQRHFNKPQRIDTHVGCFIAPTPLTTPIRTQSVVNGDVAFGLLSSIKRNTSKKPTSTTFQKSLSLGETLVSSTPGIDVTSFLLGTGPIYPPPIHDLTNRERHTENYHAVSKSSDDIHSKKGMTIYPARYEPQRSEVPTKSQSQVTHAPNSNHHDILNLQNGSFASTSRKRTYSSERELDESLSLRSSLKPKLKRVNCISPNLGVTELKPRESVAAVKDISLPATSLTDQALLDAEITLYSCLGKRIQKTSSRSLVNPLTMLFRDGDSQHFVPLCLCTETINCPVHPNIGK